MVIDGVDWQLSLSHSEVFTRQVVELQLSATGPEAFGRLKLQFPDIEGVKVYPLGMTRRSVEGETELSQRWLLVPHRDGSIVFDLPEVRYLGGKRPVRYDPDPITLSVTALPSYLPASTIVGELEWSSQLSTETALRPGELAVWTLAVQSNTVDPIQIPSVISQLQEHDEIEWLHSTVEYAEIEAEPFFKARYQMAFTVPNWPRLSLPAVEWQQFDPNTRRLTRQRFEAPAIWVLSRWQQVLGLVLLLLAGGLGLRGVLPRAMAQIRRHRLQTKLNAAIARGNYEEARQHMNALAAEWGIASNLAVEPWLSAWQQRHGKPFPGAQALRMLETAAFAP